jgi:uncharacterized protein YecE (DUF72 family)
MWRIGTAGWAIPPHSRDRVPGNGSHLERYAQRLNAAEINSSFHRHHRLQTYERWAASVPPHFRFSVKLPRALSHSGALAQDWATLEQFLAESRGLGPKLGVLLLQLPPKLEFDEPSAESFFDTFRQRTSVPLACEPRHPGWGSSRADALLAHFGVARVAADPPRWQGADQPGGARELAYFRWHGSPRTYYSNYEPERLALLQEEAVRASASGAEVWVIFDNTVLGFALQNALALSATMADATA